MQESQKNQAPYGARNAEAQWAVKSDTAVPQLSALDQRRVAIHLVAQGRERLLRGTGIYGPNSDLGGVLRVALNDEAGSYELLFVDGQWTGTIESGDAVGCDYLMHVG